MIVSVQCAVCVYIPIICCIQRALCGYDCSCIHRIVQLYLCIHIHVECGVNHNMLYCSLYLIIYLPLHLFLFFDVLTALSYEWISVILYSEIQQIEIPPIDYLFITVQTDDRLYWTSAVYSHTQSAGNMFNSFLLQFIVQSRTPAVDDAIFYQNGPGFMSLFVKLC
jgi:hypothetical protein